MADDADASAPTEASNPSEHSAVVAPPARRLEKTTACIPIAFGNISFYLGKKADEYNTHQWTLYLRAPNNEDLSQIVSKVVFHLHASFTQPTRELTQPPYEITERGWGEFEVQIRIFWKDPSEKATVVTHGLKLYPPGTPANAAPTDTKTPVVAENYDEVVFTDPSESFFARMRRLRNTQSVAYSQQDHFPLHSDTDDMATLLQAQEFLQKELTRAKERLTAVDDVLDQADRDLRTVEDKQSSRTVGSPPGKKLKVFLQQSKIADIERLTGEPRIHCLFSASRPRTTKRPDPCITSTAPEPPDF